ncbi:MAG TPA: hypothetical protein VFC84_20615 [Desulfosporosinus sp.]|nr:hypothetical protein [Desulfosporosinus sp.]
MSANLAGLTILLLTSIIMVFIVPTEKFKELWKLGLVGGLVIALILVYLMQNVWGFWTFKHVDIINIAGIPILLSVAWIPSVITFGYLMTKYHEITLIGVILFVFPLSAVAVHYIFIQLGLLQYSHWNLLYTFLISLGIHIGLATYLYMSDQLPNLAKI